MVYKNYSARRQFLYMFSSEAQSGFIGRHKLSWHAAPIALFAYTDAYAEMLREENIIP
jgi:hypothetical protein